MLSLQVLALRLRLSRAVRNVATAASEPRLTPADQPERPDFVAKSQERVPRGYWKVMENRREFMDRAGKSLGVHSMNDWYNVTKDDIIGLGGAGLLQTYYRDSLIKALQEIYPEHTWDTWRFSNAVHAWKSEEKETMAKKCRNFFDRLASQIFPGTSDQQKFYLWYSVTVNTIAQNGGAALLRANGNSLREALRLAYPEHEWDEDLFLKLPPSYWTDVVKHRALFDTIAEKLKINYLEDWYKVSTREVLKAGAKDGIVSVLPRYYKHSLLKALRTVYPDHEWLEWRFPRVAAGFWDSLDNQRRYMDWVAKERLGFEPTDYEKWYRVFYDDVARHGGYRMLAKFYNYSLLAALKRIYPEHTWEDWRISKVAAGFWVQLGERLKATEPDPQDVDQLISFVRDLESRLSISKPEDWYRISLTQLRRIGAWHAVSDLGGLPNFLKIVYPAMDWDGSLFVRPTKKSAQRELLSMVEKIFPEHEIIEEHVIETTDGDSSMTKAPRYIEIDVFLPELSLGFEFQGRHHYEDVDRVGNLPTKERADLSKAHICASRGITLISVPYWWDFQRDSLENTLHEARPDLVAKKVGKGKSIPTKPPPGATDVFSTHDISGKFSSMTLKDRTIRRKRRPAELKAQEEAEIND